MQTLSILCLSFIFYRIIPLWFVLHASHMSRSNMVILLSSHFLLMAANCAGYSDITNSLNGFHLLYTYCIQTYCLNCLIHLLPNYYSYCLLETPSYSNTFTQCLLKSKLMIGWTGKSCFLHLCYIPVVSMYVYVL